MEFQMSRDTDNLLKLDEYLLVEIFLRCSVKSLTRAIHVSKRWYVLIKNPDFIHNHLWYQKKHHKGRLLLQYLKEDTFGPIRYALFNDETLVSDTYHDLDQFSLESLHLEGPINGLFCLFDGRDRIVLWNPALKEFRTILLPHPHFFPKWTVFPSGNLGFGIDPLTHDYKLLLIRPFKDAEGFWTYKYAAVYNLTTNTWRLLYDHATFLSLGYFHKNSNSAFLNGIYYFYWTSEVFVGFDMREETFREISSPDISNDKPYFTPCYITLYKDNVSLMVQDEYFIDIWVMLGDGVWSKMISITSLPRYYLIFGMWKDNVLLFADISSETYDPDGCSRTILYNASSQERRDVGPRGINIRRCAAFIYCESLASVNCGTKHKGYYSSFNMVSGFLDSYSNPYMDTYRPE